MLIFCGPFLHLYSSTVLVCDFLFWWCMCLVWGIRVMVASYNDFGTVSSSLVFWTRLRRIGVSPSLYVWQNSPVKSSAPGRVFAGSFFVFLNYRFYFTSSDQYVQSYLFLLDSILVGCMFLKRVHFF